ncbi:MAG: DUF1844 domain-containing protein [Fimbriimonas ginsengisoli]|uniref:DUF1844 domain-containing protein n=1 Tax=Fimbriimonas ginsengisoli TaxID=1005039 RepID=A0A931LUA4_FIMGI|nr:DUF1844 domain-containing protein [Fimbriimonas ginsengisoli]
MDKAAGEPKEPIDVHLLAAVMAEQLAGIAWCKLGLQPDPVTGKIEKDLDQAKTAIDLVAYLATVVDPKLDEDDRRRMNGLVRDLRLNYVEKRKEAGDGS